MLRYKCKGHRSECREENKNRWVASHSAGRSNNSPPTHPFTSVREYKKKKKVSFSSSSWKLPGGVGDLLWLVFFIIIIPRVEQQLQILVQRFTMLQDVFLRGKKKKEKVFKTLCWRQCCCCCGRYLTELKRLISGNSMRHSYASTSSLSHLDFYRKICNTCFFNHHNQKQLYPPPFRGQAWFDTGSVL